MTVGATEAASRIAAIQQMAAALGAGPPPATAAFQQALDAASTTTTPTASATAGGSVNGVPYATEINAAATKYGIDPSLLAGLVKQESGFNPNATSSAGAKGLTQLMPATARALGVTDATNPAQALDGGAKYLREMLDKFGGDPKLALAAYNAGPGAVQRFGGIPPYAETKAYVEKVLANRDAYALSASPAAAAASATGATPVGAVASAIAPTSSAAVAALDTSSSGGTSYSGTGLGYPTT